MMIKVIVTNLIARLQTGKRNNIYIYILLYYYILFSVRFLIMFFLCFLVCSSWFQITHYIENCPKVYKICD